LALPIQRGRISSRLSGNRGSAWGLATLPYIARSHRLAEKFVCCHFGDSFRHLPFVHGDSLANQFYGSFLIGFICKEIPHNSRSSLGIESRNPHVPTCCHLRSVYLPALNPIADLFNWRGPDLLLIVWFPLEPRRQRSSQLAVVLLGHRHCQGRAPHSFALSRNMRQPRAS